MRNNRFFNAKDSVVELIEHDYNVLTVLSRFSLPLGFGQKSIGELCEESGIHTDAFLLIINFLLTGEIDSASIMKVSPLMWFTSCITPMIIISLINFRT